MSDDQPMKQPMGPEPEPASDVESAPERPSLVCEFVAFLAENKKWWLVPIILMFLLLGLLILATSSPLSPFLYTLL